MHLPRVSQPQRYRSLFVFDFGDWTAFGYTAEELALLLEDPRYAAGRVFRIERAYPDGRVELRGVSRERFHLEAGMFFYRADRAAARADFDQLVAAAQTRPPPCRAFVHLVDRGTAPGDGATPALDRASAPASPAADACPQRARYATALIYPAEYDEDMAAWLLELGYAGGDTVEGGISHVTNYYEDARTILARRQLWSTKSYESRASDEVFRTVRRTVQR